MSSTIRYSGDPDHPAYHGGAFEINVKRHDSYDWADVPGATEEQTQAAWDLLAWDWWQNIMPEVAAEHGLDPDHIGQEGRGGGWLIHYKRGPFRHCDDYGGLAAEEYAEWRTTIEAFAQQIVAELPTEDEWRDMVERYRDDATLSGLSAGQACRSCGAPQ